MLLRLSPLPTGSNVTPWREVPAFDELIGSWCAAERGDAEVAVQVRSGAGETAWYVLGRRNGEGWESVPGQVDADGEVDVDVLRLRAPADAFRLRVTGAALAALAACVSAPGSEGPSASAGRVLEIEVPPLSQLDWADVRPELDGGGRAWCSPTSLAMVLGRWGLEVEVPAVAEAVYDAASGVCGNWSSNVAFAASLGLDAVVTRLSSLTQARLLLVAGVPLVVSIVAGPGALPGFPLEAGTGGHLVVLAGETAEGDPIVYDPAATGAATVRRVYPRRAFESAWLGGSRGTAYVVRPRSHPVPASDAW